MPLDLGYSFCPNDTFIFYALAHGKIPVPFQLREQLEDVETLNQWAKLAHLPITKISYRAYAEVRDKYIALRAGGALGRGVGPLLVSKQPLAQLKGKRIGSPGALTTAELLLRLYDPSIEVVHLRYDQIMPAITAGELDAGLIIHESRFTYAQYGLHAQLDLGAWWEQQTNLPLPLGAILLRRDLAETLGAPLNRAIVDSLQYAYAHPSEPKAYIRRHALEMDDAVMQAHIDLYVNEYSLDVGTEGEQAAQTLFAWAQEQGLVPKYEHTLFIDR